MRGEYELETTIPITRMELPPRARRIPPLKQCCGLSMGTTSACAENTKTAQDANYHTRNYLRVRGEYALTCGLRRSLMELPPRARRIRPSGIDRWAGDGTTSACAENTAMLDIILPGWRNYLRVRGEYMVCGWLHIMWVELPPRARRIPRGTASNHSPGRNYLRVRGEYCTQPQILVSFSELPPRARRIRPPAFCN